MEEVKKIEIPGCWVNGVWMQPFTLSWDEMPEPEQAHHQPLINYNMPNPTVQEIEQETKKAKSLIKGILFDFYEATGITNFEINGGCKVFPLNMEVKKVVTMDVDIKIFF